mgnify:CR=1 FL=1
MYNVLVCDDDRDIVAALKIYLSSGDYQVFEAYDGAGALAVAAKEDIHLVLLDVMMPGMDGIETLTKLREHSNIPVILLTAKSEDTDKILGLNVGADDYITKPYNPTILLLRINALLKRAAASSANNSTFYRGMEILPQKGVIKYNDGRDEMLFTKNEMTIFMCLLAKKDRIVSRDELMTELWNNEEYLNDNALTVNISRLRARFKDIGIEDVIETRKGQGYILV